MKPVVTFACLMAWFLTERGTAEVSFNEDIRAILSDACFHCHGPDTAKQYPKSKPLGLHTFGSATRDRGGYAAIVPGDPENSAVIQRLFSEDEDERMPPSDAHRTVTAEQKALLRQWIEEGATYEDHWAFLPPVTPPLPTVENEAWVRNPIDAFVLARLESEGLMPSPEADPERLLRRATQTLTGLLPTPAEVEAFADEVSEEAYSALLDRLLESERYGERMAFFWLEAARYADTDGYQNDGERTMWPWRDWVIKAFNENMPYDEFSIKQLAGDMLPGGDVQNVLASAFNRNHRVNNEGGALPEEFIVEYAIDRVETTSTVWLGLTAACARCHDHKYDPYTQKEFFQFYAYFNNIPELGKAAGRNAPPQITIASPLQAPEVSQTLAKLREKLHEVRAGLPRKWPQAWEESLQAQPDLSKGLKDALQAKRRNGRQIQLLREAYWKTFPEVTKLTDRIDALIAEHDLKEVNVLVMQEKEERGPTYLLERGQYTSPDKSESLFPGLPAALGGDRFVPQDRLELARWLVSRDNPLGARVLVNRVWQQHFGRGLVSTPENFGVQGAAPSHPELLDWLAVDFMEHGWDLKRLHKQILSSATWRQQSQAPAERFAQDPQNVLLARGPRFRLDASAIRDTALQAAGLLDETLGGPPVKPHQPEGLWQVVAGNQGTRYRPSQGADLYRRGLYTYWKRAVNPPRMLLFDAATREYCSVGRTATNTPLQALVLMNDITFVEAARALAERMIREGGDTLDERLTHGFRCAVGGNPSALELDSMRSTYEEFHHHFTDHPEAAKAFLAQGKEVSAVIPDLVEQAAFMAAAHLALNLDRTLTLE